LCYFFYEKYVVKFVDQLLCEPQVFVAAFRKRNLSVPEDLVGMHETTSIEVLERTSGFK